MKSDKYFYQGNNYEIEFEINDWAERSLISLLTKSKDTVILTVINLGDEIPNADFLPLTIDYEEKFYAGGKIYGARFVRREGKPTITSILNSRVIDRSVRPLFPPDFKRQISIINTVLSYDPQSDPALLALLGTSFGIRYLQLPFINTLAATRVGYGEKGWRINPEIDIRGGLKGELFLSGTKNKINMIEFEGINIKEKDILEGIKIGLEEIKKIVNFIDSSLPFSDKKIDFDNSLYQEGEKLLEEFLDKNKIEIKKVLFNSQEGDKTWEDIFELLKNENFEDKQAYVFSALQKKFKKIFQQTVLSDKIRPDGRKLDEIRNLSMEIDLLPRVHGSALFKRGLTHILSTVTLAGPGEELVLREIEYEGVKSFIHHYNFPPYSTGEIGSPKAPSRREIGHGELAEKALRNLIPSQDVFPYTIRVVSDVLSSNGSTSMGSVCGSSLALMAAGVPLDQHISGISIGLVYEDDNNYELLTDIQGPEDFFGAMDFKIAGTKEGITAFQLDVKIEGLTIEQILRSFEQARKANNFILEKMNQTISKPQKLSPFAPRVISFKVDPLKIGLIIGSGGKTINEIIENTNTKITINPDGLIYIIGEEGDIHLAKNLIKIISGELKLGEIVKGKVVKILPFGAVLELAPQKTAFLHISEIANKKITNIEEEIKVGDEVDVSIKEIDERGRVYVSLKNARRQEGKI